VLHVASLILQAANRAQADRLTAFYQANNAQFVIPRPYEEFSRAIERGQFFVVTDRNEEIVAASGVFDYSDDAPFVEMADTLVAKHAQGFGLQRLFFRLRIASIVVTQGPSIGITTAVDPANHRSLQTTLEQGFQLWATPIGEAYKSCPNCPNKAEHRACCCDFYLLPSAKAVEAVRTLLEESNTGLITLASRDRRALELNASCAVLQGEHRAALHEFVAGATW
jgi:hypothetical protein